jgi:hypothetical protein
VNEAPMLDWKTRIDHLARLAAEAVAQHLSTLPSAARIAHVIAALDAVAPELSERFVSGLQYRRLEHTLARVLADHMTEHVLRIGRDLVPSIESIVLGLGAATPPAIVATERDDVVLHNNASTKTKQWHEQTYRGLWYQGFQTPIKDLTTHDVALATAYLGGKLKQRGCPDSDKTKSEKSWNLAYKIIHAIEAVAGMVAGLVLTVIYGPIAGLAVSYLHKAKMALMDRFWKLKVGRDPAFRALVQKLQPQGWMSYRGFKFQMRPYGNLLVQELGCRGNLATRLRMHGRVLRMIDVLCASAPTAKSRPGGYDYLSAFGQLKGSIFPPRGPQLDGVPAPPTVVAQVDKAIKSAPMQALLKQPAQPAHAMLPTPPALLQSAALLQAHVQTQSATAAPEPAKPAATTEAKVQTAQRSEAQRPTANHVVPWLLLGGAALGVAFLATR